MNRLLEKQRKPHRGFLCYNTSMRRNDRIQVSHIPTLSMAFLKRCLAGGVLISVFLSATACADRPIPTPTPGPSSVYTIASQSTIDRKTPEETVGPIGFYGERELADAVAPFREMGYQGTILIVKDGVVRYEDYSGYANVEHEFPIREVTTYEIGGITRQFTAVGVLKLSDDGLIDLDVPISEYIPEYVHAEQITIRMLLEMTSGIPDYLRGTLADKDYTEGRVKDGLTHPGTLELIDSFGGIDLSFEAVLEQIGDKSLLFEPGTEFSLSNTGYVFLSEIIERVSGIPYIHYIQKNVLTPAGLETATFTASSDTAIGYVSRGTLQYIAPGTPLLSDCGLRMSAKDLAAWIRLIDAGTLLSPDSRDLLLRPGEHEYGTGITVKSDGTIIEKSDMGGFSATMAYVPSDDLTVVVLLNRNGDVRWADSLLETVFDYYDIGENGDTDEAGS